MLHPLAVLESSSVPSLPQTLDPTGRLDSPTDSNSFRKQIYCRNLHWPLCELNEWRKWEIYWISQPRVKLGLKSLEFKWCWTMTTNEGGGFWIGKNWDKFELDIKQSQKMGRWVLEVRVLIRVRSGGKVKSLWNEREKAFNVLRFLTPKSF